MVGYLLGLDFNFNFFFIKGFFEIVVTVTVQNTFRLKIYQNNIFFYFLKIIFDINTSK